MNDLRDFLDFKFRQYNKPGFITNDPVSIPHLFKRKEDIEIAGFLAATIAWGQRKTILTNARKLISMMDDQPYEFIMHTGAKDFVKFENFVHRTFQGLDCIYFLTSLQNIYQNHGGLEACFAGDKVKEGIMNFRKLFFSLPHLKRTEKHLANPDAGASAKRINMFLRWMIRQDDCRIDFGIWEIFKPAQLLCPLDIHSGNVARKLGLLKRKQNDWKAVEELTQNLSIFDPEDPVKYDIALFALGIEENFSK